LEHSFGYEKRGSGAGVGGEDSKGKGEDQKWRKGDTRVRPPLSDSKGNFRRVGEKAPLTSSEESMKRKKGREKRVKVNIVNEEFRRVESAKVIGGRWNLGGRARSDSPLPRDSQGRPD